MIKVYSVSCEYDIGQDARVFVSKERAIRWLHDNDILYECFNDGDTVDSFFKDGLLSIEELELDE